MKASEPASALAPVIDTEIPDLLDVERLVLENGSRLNNQAPGVSMHGQRPGGHGTLHPSERPTPRHPRRGAGGDRSPGRGERAAGLPRGLRGGAGQGGAGVAACRAGARAGAGGGGHRLACRPPRQALGSRPRAGGLASERPGARAAARPRSSRPVPGGPPAPAGERMAPPPGRRDHGAAWIAAPPGAGPGDRCARGRHLPASGRRGWRLRPRAGARAALALARAAGPRRRRPGRGGQFLPLSPSPL